jgi:hypothetical protein
MPTLAIPYSSDAERIALERALAFVAQMHQLARTAPDGQVLDACERQALHQGRDLLRCTLQQAVQARIGQAEDKKGGPHAPARAAALPATRGGTSAG